MDNGTVLTEARADGIPLTIPKIDLHRHLEGAVRLGTIVEIAGQFDLDLPRDEENLRRQVQVLPNDSRNHEFFLKRFRVIRKIFQSAEVIRRIVREAIEDAAADNVKYLELRFTPAALTQTVGFPLDEATDWVIEAASEAQRDFSIKVGLIASVNRHEDPRIAASVFEIVQDRSGEGVLGIDLAGDELQASMMPFKPVFEGAKSQGLGITIHAGEWAGAQNVREAILEMGADRIGHGVRVMDNPEIIELARDRGVCFEVSLSSNLLTGAVNSIDEHPLLAMIQAGLRLTLTTDDPSIFGTTLSKEYALAIEHFQLSEESLKAMVMTAVQSSFLPDREKNELEKRMVSEIWETDEAMR
jgi:adenosine deaminase